MAPGDTVNLLVNGSVLGSATVQVVNGVAEATFTVEFFGPGRFTFSAQYLGSSVREHQQCCNRQRVLRLVGGAELAFALAASPFRRGDGPREGGTISLG